MDEDAVLLAIGRLEGKMDGIGSQIGDLKTCISICQVNCASSRKTVGDRLRIVEDFRLQVLAYAALVLVVITITGYFALKLIFGGH